MQEPLLLSASDDGSMYFIISVIAFIIGVYITRWIFGIPTIIENLKLQTANQKIMRKVINELAARQGMSKEDIDRIEEESVQEVYK